MESRVRAARGVGADEAVRSPRMAGHEPRVSPRGSPGRGRDGAGSSPPGRRRSPRPECGATAGSRSPGRVALRFERLSFRAPDEDARFGGVSRPASGAAAGQSPPGGRSGALPRATEQAQLGWGRAHDDTNAAILFEKRAENLVVPGDQGDGFDGTGREPVQELGREKRLSHEVHAQAVGLGLHDDDILARSDASTIASSVSRDDSARGSSSSPARRSSKWRRSGERPRADGRRYFSGTTSQGPSAWMKKTASSFPSTFATWAAFSVSEK